MTLNEAIEYYINVATRRAMADEGIGVSDKWKETKFMTKQESEQIIADNRQLAEWLTELKELRSLKTDYVFFKAEAKKLLKAAVDDFSNMYDHIYYCDGICDTCPLHGERDNCLVWQYADEAEKLLKEE